MTTPLHGTIGPNDCTDAAEVWFVVWPDGGPDLIKGRLIVRVSCEDLPEDASEDAQMENHPASRAEVAAIHWLEERWPGADIELNDIRAY